jgi:hypothetical protein
MKFNMKKTKTAQSHEHYDAMLNKQREQRGHSSSDNETYQKQLSTVRKDKENADNYEQKLKSTHKEEKQDQRITEQWLNDEDKRSDITHATNTLPINELAEEAQRARIKARGDGDGFVEDHFQDYKKESMDLNGKIKKLTEINRMIDKLWMASSWGRLTTAEKKKVSSLQKQRDDLLK